MLCSDSNVARGSAPKENECDITVQLRTRYQKDSNLIGSDRPLECKNGDSRNRQTEQLRDILPPSLSKQWNWPELLGYYYYRTCQAATKMDHMTSIMLTRTETLQSALHKTANNVTIILL